MIHEYEIACDHHDTLDADIVCLQVQAFLELHDFNYKMFVHDIAHFLSNRTLNLEL